MATSSRGYTAGKFTLEIEGKDAGFLDSVEGGEAVASVVAERADAGVGTGVVRKHIGDVTYAPLRMELGSGMAASVHERIGNWLQGNAAPFNGAVVFLDYNFREQRRLEFRDARIVEVAFPAMDGGDRTRVHIVLTLQPASTRFDTSSSGTHRGSPAGKSQKQPLASNFRLAIRELVTRHVGRVEALVVKQAITVDFPRDAVLQPLLVPNLVFTLPEADAKDCFDWFDDFVIKGDSQQDRELSGSLEWLAPDGKQVLFKLDFLNLGIFRIQRERSETGVELMARVRVSLYCEQMRFAASPPQVEAPIAAPAGAPLAQVGAVLAEALLGIVSGRLQDVTALRQRLGAAPSEPSRVAERLCATLRVAEPVAPPLPRRDEGSALGVRWASAAATLEELQQFAALEAREWSAVKLDPSHSLVGALVSEGLLPAGAAEGSLALERDAFVEGLVAGASQVLRDAAPHLAASDTPA